MSKTDTTVLTDGQLAVATLAQTGTPITGSSVVDATALVETEQGPQLCVKTYSVGGGGGGGADTNLSNLTNTGKTQAAHLAMPSNVYEELTVPADNQTMTAPADGYFAAELTATNATYLFLTNTSNGLKNGMQTRYSADMLRAMCIAAKGQEVKIEYYTNSSNISVRFIYAEGSKTEAN